MDESIVSKIEETLSKVRPSLGKADVQLKEIHEGVVVVEYRKAPSSIGVCHPDKTQTTRELVTEILEDALSKVVPDFEKVIVME